MKTSLSALALIFTLLGQSQQNEVLEIDMQFQSDILMSLSTHLVSNMPTQIEQISLIPITTQLPQTTKIPQCQFTKQVQSTLKDDFNGYVIIPLTTVVAVQQTPTPTSVIHVTKTVVEMVKAEVSENKSDDADVEEEEAQKIEHEEKHHHHHSHHRNHHYHKRRHHNHHQKRKHHHQHQRKNHHINTERIKETTEVLNIVVATPTVKVNVQEERVTDMDVNEIWKILESDSKPRRKVKKTIESKNSPACGITKIKEEKIETGIKEIVRHAKVKDETKELKERLRKLEDLLSAQVKEKKVKEELKEKQVAEKISTKIETVAPLKLYNQGKRVAKKFHTLPAKRNKDSCLLEQTIIIPAKKIAAPTIPPPLVSKIGSMVNGTIVADKTIYTCITNYAGTATTTVTSMTIVPMTTTQLSVKTETVFTRTTDLLTEVLYTPYTVTTTSTNTMYMIKVTTVHGAGCKNCELDSNGMVLPAGQLPPGIFATPLNEVDPNKYDIIGYAGINPSNFDPNLQGFKTQI